MPISAFLRWTGLCSGGLRCEGADVVRELPECRCRSPVQMVGVAAVYLGTLVGPIRDRQYRLVANLLTLSRYGRCGNEPGKDLSRSFTSAAVPAAFDLLHCVTQQFAVTVIEHH